jgi:hypothetical protein
MEKSTFKVYKELVNHEFTIDVIAGKHFPSINIDGKAASFDEQENKLEFVKAIKIGKSKISGLKIDDRQDIVEYIKDAFKKVEELIENEENEKEADRPAPVVDQDLYFAYRFGCDSGIIYPEQFRNAVELALKNGLKPEKVFNGIRDGSRKFAGYEDACIPASYVSEREEYEEYSDETKYRVTKYAAAGYSSIWCADTFALPKKIVMDMKRRLDEERTRKTEARKVKEEERISAIFAKAKESGERQILEQWSDDCNDREEECSVDNIIVYALWDGKTETTRYHTY